MANILAISDFHCGSAIGWTPRSFLKRSPMEYEVRRARRWVLRELAKFDKFDHILFLGDAIEGQQCKDRSCGLLTADLHEQVDMAEESFEEFLAFGTDICDVSGVTGTDYHAGIMGTSAEQLIAKRMKWAGIGHRYTVNIDGCRIDMRHKTSKSSTLHTGANALQAEALNNLAKAKSKGQTRPDCLLRGHIHQSLEVRAPELGVAISLPALQMGGGKFGQQICNGWVHFGFHVLETDGRNVVGSHPRWIPIQPTDVPEVVL